MTKKEIAQEFLSRYGITVEKGSGAEFILPYLIMDLVYSEYNHYIRPASSQKLRQIATEWGREYTRFNHNFFSHFSKDTADAVIELMDGIEDYVSHDITVLRVQLSNLVSDIPVDQQWVLSSCFLCNILCQAAQTSMKEVYRKLLGRDVYSPEIQNIQGHTMRWGRLYYKHRGYRDIDLGSSKPVLDAVGVLCRKLVRFLNEDD